MGNLVTSRDKCLIWLSCHSRIVTVVLLVLAFIYPFAVSPYILSLAIEVLIFAIFAMSLDLLIGYTGLPSFGHAAFLGLGSYILAYITSTSDLAIGLTDNILVSLPMVVLGTGMIALLIGLFALRTTGIYFLMITLAFAQMLFSIAIHWSRVTGGSDGMTGVQRPSLGIGTWEYSFDTRSSFYYLVLLLFILVWCMLRMIVRSPFGLTLRGIRTNEHRMRALGYNTFYYKIAAFVLAGMLAGLSGMLLAQFFWHASPHNLFWSMSGQAVIMVLVGGAGTLTGPVIGAAVMRLLPHLASTYTERWQTLMGIVLILFVVFSPSGIIGILGGRRKDSL